VSSPAPTTTAAPLAPLGVEKPRSSVPWAAVGQGWFLATWSPAQPLAPGEAPAAGQATYQTATTTLYLVDPAGGRYVITTFPPSADGSPTLMDWSGDGQHALLEQDVTDPSTTAAQTVITEVDLGTGATSNFTVGIAVDAHYTLPDGHAILLSTSAERGTPSAPSLERVDLGGTEQLTFPVDQLGSAFNGGFLSYPDGSQLVLGTADGLVVVGNDGTVGHQIPMPGPSGCMPLRWWTSTQILAACTGSNDTSRLWLVPASGAAPTALTAPLTGQQGPDAADEDAWQLPAGTFLQDAGACGYQYLAKLNPDGTTTPVTVPGVANGDSQLVVGTDGPNLALHAAIGCGAGESLLVYNPTANTSTVLLGPPVNGGGVVSALVYPAS